MRAWMLGLKLSSSAEYFKKYITIRKKTMLLLLLLKIKENVTLLSQVRDIIILMHRVLARHIRIYYDNNGAGRVARVFTCSNICVIDDLTRSDIFVYPLNTCKENV